MFLLDEKNRGFAEGKAPRPNLDQSMGCVALFIVPFVLAGLWVLFMTGVAWRDYSDISRFGQTTEGTVVRKWIVHDSEGADDPYLGYTFQAEGGSWEGQDKVGIADYHRAEEGGQVTVLYSARRPAINCLQDYFTIEDAVFLSLFSLFWNGIIGVFAWGMYTTWRRHSAGRMVTGEVVKAELLRDADGTLRVEYTFRGPLTGRPVTGVCSSVSDQQAPEPGTKVAVLYLSDRSHELL